MNKKSIGFLGENKSDDVNKFLKVINFKKQSELHYSERVVRDSIVTWGEDNTWPKYLQGLLDKSSKHNAIVKSKSSMIGGGGFNANDNTINEQLINNIEGVYTLDEILTRISYDFEVYGNFCLNLIWSRDRKKISRINYIDVSKCRMVPSECGTFVSKYLISDNWEKSRGNRRVEYAPFSVENRELASQILWVKDYRPGSEWYSLPEYISSANWIQLEYEISEFHLSQVQNGFHPSMLINFSSQIPSQEEMDMVISRLKKEYEGASNGGKVIFTFSDGSQNAPIITPISLNNSDNRFIDLNKEVTEGIMSGHRVINPSLFGIKTEGELGGKNNILESMDIFTAQYIKPKQKIIEDVINKIANVNGGGDITINKFKIETTIQPNVSEVLSILTSAIGYSQKAELLKLVGYDDQSIKKLLTTNDQQI